MSRQACYSIELSGAYIYIWVTLKPSFNTYTKTFENQQAWSWSKHATSVVLLKFKVELWINGVVPQCVKSS